MGLDNYIEISSVCVHKSHAYPQIIVRNNVIAFYDSIKFPILDMSLAFRDKIVISLFLAVAFTILIQLN